MERQGLSNKGAVSTEILDLEWGSDTTNLVFEELRNAPPADLPIPDDHAEIAKVMAAAVFCAHGGEKTYAYAAELVEKYLEDRGLLEQADNTERNIGETDLDRFAVCVRRCGIHENTLVGVDSQLLSFYFVE